MKRYPFVLFTLLVSLVIPGCAMDKDNPVLATYDGGSIRSSDFKDALTGLPEAVRSMALRKKRDFLESMVTEKLLLQEAEKRGLQHNQAVGDLIHQARTKILVAKLIEEEVDSKIDLSGDRKRRYYDNHTNEFMNPLRLRASHILLRSREEAQKVLDELNTGEKFEELAKRYSLDPTGPRGGDLGFFQRGQLIPEIEEAAFALSKGEISQPIQSTFGFHVIMLSDAVEAQVKEYSSVENDIERRITFQDRSRYFKEYTEEIKSKGRLVIREESLDAFEPEGTT